MHAPNSDAVAILKLGSLIPSALCMITPSRRIPCLDGLRAVSILLVLLGHASHTVALQGFLFEIIDPVITNASLGVTVFFVISGYLITYLLKTEWGYSGSIDLRAFYIRRVLRIFPAFYTYIIVISILTFAGLITVSSSQIFSAGTFLWNYRHHWEFSATDGNWFLGHFWTLSLEEQFYLLWPAILLVCSPRLAARVALTLIIISPLLRVATYFLWPAARAQIGLMLHTASDPLMFGCLAALAQGNPWFESGWQRIERLSWIAPVSASAFLLFVAPFFGRHFHGAYGITVGMTLSAGCITLIMIWLVRHPQSIAGEIMQHPLLIHLGMLSYSLYIWQQVFLTTLNATWSGRFPINLLVIFGVAEISYFCVERPFLRLRRRSSPTLIESCSY